MKELKKTQQFYGQLFDFLKKKKKKTALIPVEGMGTVSNNRQPWMCKATPALKE